MDSPSGQLSTDDQGSNDFNVVEKFDRNGTLLSEPERLGIAKQRGLCYLCGRKTHQKRRILSNLALTNDDVFEGICIPCYPENVPKHVHVAWKKRNKVKTDTTRRSPSADGQQSLSQRERRARRERDHGFGRQQRHHQQQHRVASERNLDKGTTPTIIMQRGGSDPLLGDVDRGNGRMSAITETTKDLAAPAALTTIPSSSSTRKPPSRRRPSPLPQLADDALDQSERSLSESQIFATEGEEEVEIPKKKSPNANDSTQNFGTSSRSSNRDVPSASERSKRGDRLFEEQFEQVSPDSKSSELNNSRQSMRSDLNSSSQSFRSKSDFHNSASSFQSRMSKKHELAKDESERRIPSNKCYEEEERRIYGKQIADVKGSARSMSRSDLNASEKSLTRSIRSLVDDWRPELLGLPPADIAEILAEHMDNASTIRRTLHESRNYYTGEGREVLMQPMKAILKSHERDPYVLDVACGGLWRITADDLAAKRDAVESGSIDLVLDALTKNRSDYELAEWAMGAILSVAVEPDYKEYLSQKNAVEVILESLKTHQEKAIVFEWACRCLYALVTTFSDTDEELEDYPEITARNLALIDESGGIAIIVEAMNANISEHAALVVAIDLLWRLLGNANAIPDSRIVRKYWNVGLAPLLMNLLRLQSTTTELFERVAELLSLLLSDEQCSPNSAEKFIVCLPSILRRMREGHQNERLLKASFRIFGAALILLDIPISALQDTAAPQRVVDALKSLPDDEESVTSGMLVLWKLSSYAPLLLDKDMVISSIDFIKAAVSSESLSLICYTAALGFVVNVRQTPDLQSSELSVSSLLAKKFVSQADNDAARAVASESFPLICSRFPELGNDTVKCMIDDETTGFDGAESFGRLYTLAQTIVAAGAKADLDLPAKVSESIVKALPDIKDSATLNVFLNAVVCILTTPKTDSVLPPSTLRILVDLFEHNQEDQGLSLLILNAMAHILQHSPSNIAPEIIAMAILDFALSPSLSMNAKKAAAVALWTLLATNACDDRNILYRAYTYALGVLGNFSGDSAEPFHATLIEAASGVLCAVARLSKLAPFEVPMTDVDVMVGMVYACLEHEDMSPAIPTLLLEALYYFSFAHQKTLIACGIIVLVADAIQKYNNSSPELLDIGFNVLAKLASSEDVHIHLGIAFSDGIDSIIRGMARFPAHNGIQTAGCQALSHLSVDGEPRNEVFVRGGVALLVKAIEEHESDCDLIGFACSALLNITTDMPESSIIGCGMVEKIVTLLQKYEKSPSLQQTCIGILQNTAMKGPAGKDAIARLGAINAVCQCMEKHWDRPLIIERAFTTLWSLAVLEKNRLRILESWKIESAVHNMLCLLEYEGVQAQACGFLCTLALEKSARGAIAKAKACDAVLFAMKVHYSSVRVQREAARALSVIYGASDTGDGNEGGGLQPSNEELQAVLAAMERFPREEELQVRSCAAILSILLSPGGDFGLYLESIREAVNSASQRFPSCDMAAVQIQSLLSSNTQTRQADNDPALQSQAKIATDVKKAASKKVESVECCFCTAECGDDFCKCSGSDQQHILCRDCGQLYVGTALDPEGSFYHVQHKGGNENSETRSALFQIPCPVFLNSQDSCDCAALDSSDVKRLLSGRKELSQKLDIFIKSQAESSETHPVSIEEYNGKPIALPTTPTAAIPRDKDARPSSDNVCDSGQTRRSPSVPLDISREAVVVVGLLDWDTGKIVSRGTGFVIDHRAGLVVTSGQNLINILGEQQRPTRGDNVGIPRGEVAIGVLSEPSASDSTQKQNAAVFRYVAKIVAKDSSPNVYTCVLKIISRFENDVEMEGVVSGGQTDTSDPSSMNSEGLMSLKLAEDVSVKDHIRVFGYELGTSNSGANGLQVCVDGFVSEETEKECNDQAKGYRDEVVVICPATSGQIGGPCVNQRGEVVAILSRADGESSERWCVTPTSAWIHLIRIARDASTESNKARGSYGGDEGVPEKDKTLAEGIKGASPNGEGSWILVDSENDNQKTNEDPTEDRFRPLHSLCMGGSFDEIFRLLEEDATLVRQVDENGDLPLHVLCKNPTSTKAVIEYVLDLYPDAMDVKNSAGLTPSDVATELDAEVVHLLSARCQHQVSTPECFPLHDVCSKPTVTLADIQSKLADFPDHIGLQDDEGMLPINVACRSGAPLAVIKCLLEDFPESVERTNKGGSLPIHTACSNKASIETVQFLIDAWPESLGVSNHVGWTPLVCACAKGASAEVVQLLLDRNQDACRQATNSGKDLPLHMACCEGASVDVIDCLIQADNEAVKQTNASGELALHKACLGNAPLEVIERLVGAYPESIFVQDHLGCTPKSVVDRNDSQEARQIASFLSTRESEWC